MVAKRRAPFKDKYVVELGLRVGDRDASSNDVLTAVCMFCEMFGREDKVGGKRRSMDKVAVFKPPFRKDAIRQHHTGQHPMRWARYAELSSDDGKRAYFMAAARSSESSPQVAKASRTSSNGSTTTATTRTRPNEAAPITAEAEQRQPASGSAVHWLVNRDIVTVLLANMPYAAVGSSGQNRHEQAISGFQDTMDLSETSGDGSTADAVSSRYRIVVDDWRQFQQFVEFLNASGSLTHTAKILRAIRPMIGNDTPAPAVDVARYARYMCAINFQRIAEVCASSWGYAIGLKVAPIAPAAIFDVQTEFCLHVQLCLFVSDDVKRIHVVSVPLSKRRLSDPPESRGVFEVAEAALDAITPRWRDAILAVVSDSGGVISETSENPQTLFRNAVASRFERVAKPGFFRVCSTADQLDSLMQTFFVGLSGGDAFYSKLTESVAYLSRQRALLGVMQTNVPAVGSSDWRSMADMAIWFCRHGTSIREHFANEQAVCAPTNWWWIRLMVAARVAQETILVLADISGLTSRISKPQPPILRLRSYLVDWFTVVNSSESNDHATAAARSRNEMLVSSKNGKYSVKREDAVGALVDLGSFVAGNLQSSENRANRLSTDTMIKDVSASVVNLVAGLTSISDSINETCSELPPVLPHELVEMRGRQFTAIIGSQMERLLVAGWSKQEIDWIGQEFQDLRGAYFREPFLKEALHKCTSQTSFRNAWSCLQGRFIHLQRFCGALATAYPTAGVSSCAGSDVFHQVGNRAATTVSGLLGDVEFGVSDLSVQAVLQAAQFRLLHATQPVSL
ncbi:hypothetical protein PHYBOEH_003617 [Phytophthora boehmeriae]|uniref:Uncharacterized protein n=1 Tax=Phytophthora boehmeriae TaxID=109152 RepID=A0A8T1WQ38_9STRA|nr:hypothetical protein PHYBOEH_003617 [Phytophthora boehmeriae]